MTEREIRDLFDKFNVTLADSDIWFVQRNPVVRHSALERLAAAMKVDWIDVDFVHISDKSAVLMVRGRRGDGTPADEWSTGEAVIGQNYQVSGKQAAYPVAMAEKRAKDRVILKLARLYGVYSEDEADEFKAAAPVDVKSTAATKANEGTAIYSAWFLSLSKDEKRQLVESGDHAKNKTTAANADSEAA